MFLVTQEGGAIYLNSIVSLTNNYKTRVCMGRITILGVIIFIFIPATTVAKADQSLINELIPVAKKLINTIKSGNVTGHHSLGINKDEARYLINLNIKYAKRNARNNSLQYISGLKGQLNNLDALMKKRDADRKLYFHRAVSNINAILRTSELKFISIRVDKFAQRGNQKALYARIYFGKESTILQIHVNYIKLNGVWKINKARSYQVKRVAKVL